VNAVPAFAAAAAAVGWHCIVLCAVCCARAHLQAQEHQAIKDQAAAEEHFRTWAARWAPLSAPLTSWQLVLVEGLNKEGVAMMMCCRGGLLGAAPNHSVVQHVAQHSKKLENALGQGPIITIGCVAPPLDCHRYVPGAKYMNVNSGVQIRQLLFPDSCEGPTKMFKTLNPEYDPSIKPRPRRFIDFELHGVWGKGEKGRLAVDVTTDKVGR
jgi:hypothetical protein